LEKSVPLHFIELEFLPSRMVCAKSNVKVYRQTDGRRTKGGQRSSLTWDFNSGELINHQHRNIVYGWGIFLLLALQSLSTWSLYNAPEGSPDNAVIGQ
jgi:hypothetical protein